MSTVITLTLVVFGFIVFASLFYSGNALYKGGKEWMAKKKQSGSSGGNTLQLLVQFGIVALIGYTAIFFSTQFKAILNTLNKMGSFGVNTAQSIYNNLTQLCQVQQDCTKLEGKDACHQAAGCAYTSGVKDKKGNPVPDTCEIVSGVKAGEKRAAYCAEGVTAFVFAGLAALFVTMSMAGKAIGAIRKGLGYEDEVADPKIILTEKIVIEKATIDGKSQEDVNEELQQQTKDLKASIEKQFKEEDKKSPSAEVVDRTATEKVLKEIVHEIKDKVAPKKAAEFEKRAIELQTFNKEEAKKNDQEQDQEDVDKVAEGLDNNPEGAMLATSLSLALSPEKYFYAPKQAKQAKQAPFVRRVQNPPQFLM